jgi:hypothetical protein
LPSNSHAPVPPNVHLSRALSSHPNESLEYTRAFREAEVARGASQIAAAFEAFDLRNIRQIRRATHETIVHDARTHATATVAGGSVGNQDILTRDEADIGGAEGLAQAHDKSQLRVRRCFEIVMISGYVIRFEVRIFGAIWFILTPCLILLLDIFLPDESRMGRTTTRTCRILDAAASR